MNFIDYNWVDVNFGAMIANGTLLYALLFMLIGSIVFAFKLVYHMIAFYVSIFFINKAKINLNVDEDFIIRDSYVELSSGKTIPIKINKIKWNISKDELKKVEEINKNG